jgi:hypothetical protein
VRDRQQVVARLALNIHPVPKVRRVHRIECSERLLRHVLAVLEEDVAVEVHVVRHRRPLVRAEGRELAGLVGFFGELDVSLPDRVRDLRVHQLLDRGSAKTP